MAYNSGPVSQQQTYSYVPNEVFGIAINWFAPRTPLMFRQPKVPDGASIFQMVGYKYRPRTTTLGAALADNTNTTVTLADASIILQGDILLLASGEYVEVTADPTITNTTSGAGTVTVRRGAASSTAAAQNNSTTVRIVGNSRTGAENSPTAISTQLTSVTQYMQTILHPYSVGGSVQANTLFPTLPGTATPLESYKMVAMQNAMDDCEYSAYFGKAEATSATVSRPKMGGLRNLISTNLVTSPSDAAAYKATSFQRDLLTAPRTSGGQPDLVFVSSNWMDAFSTWGQPLQLIQQGETVFGRPINVYAAPFLGDVTIIEASLLPSYTAFSITSAECRWRVRRPLTDEPYGKTGDTTQGHMVAELAIELDNEFHHAWLQGVTAFSA